MAIVTMAFLILGSLRYASYQTHEAKLRPPPSSKHETLMVDDGAQNMVTGETGNVAAEVLAAN